MRNARSVSRWCDEAPSLPAPLDWSALAARVPDTHPLVSPYPHPSREYRDALALAAQRDFIARTTIVSPRTA